MKNKSKRDKIKQGNKKTVSYPKEWLYLNTQEITPRQIAEVFAGESEETLHAQLWEDAGVVEVELPGEAKSIDFELTSTDFGDDYSNEYLSSHGIKTAYLVTLVPEDYNQAHDAMKQIIAALGGYFCGDTEDFTPQVTGE